MKSSSRPPGPPQRLFRGSLVDFRSDVLAFVRDCAKRYGDVVGFRLGHRRCVLVNHPDLIEQVLVKNNKNFVKPFAVRIARPVFGNGLLASEGDFWRRQRRLAAPAFQSERIASYGPDMVAATLRMLETWQDGGTRDINADMSQLTLDIVAQTLFGSDVSGETHDVDKAFRGALRAFAFKVSTTVPLPAWVPTPNNRRFHRAVRGLDRVVQQMIDQRRTDNRPRKDLLSIMLNARDEDDGSQMTDRQLNDELRTFLLAGHETTAITMTWSWYLLATHPQVFARLASELETVLGGRLPQVSDLPRLKYCEQIVLEAMRLYPPAYMIGRQALGAFELGEYKIPAGTTVFMSQWVVHHDERFYPRPEQFEPERWSEEQASSLPKMAYFPFGGGQRICIGNSFAMMESVLLLATIAQRWSFRLVPDHPIKLAPLFTLRPRYGIAVVATKRCHDEPTMPQNRDSAAVDVAR